MLVFVLALAAAPTTAEDWLEKWRRCTIVFADAAAVTSERGDVIAETAMVACETEERNFAFSWAYHLLAKSITIRTQQAADAAADEFRRQEHEAFRKAAMVEVSYQRQIDAHGRQLRN